MSSIAVEKNIRMSLRVIFLGFEGKENTVGLLKTIKAINIF